MELLAGSTRLHFSKLVKILGTSGRRAPGAVPVRPELVTLGTPVEPPPGIARQCYSGLPAALVEITAISISKMDKLPAAAQFGTR